MKKLHTKKGLSSFLMIVFYVIIISSGCKKTANRQAELKLNVKDEAATVIDGKSEVIYINVKPDSIIISSVQQLYNLDLNNDNIADFIFTEKGTPAQNCRNKTGIIYAGGVRPAGKDRRHSGGVNNGIVYNGGVPVALDSFAIIDSNSNWTKDTTNKMLFVNTIGSAAACNPPSGPWNASTNKYLGLKIVKKGQSYYGWARIFKINATSMILTGYAYNRIANKSILAGQTK